MLWSQLGVSGPAGAQSTTQPTRSTSEPQLDAWNQAFRQSSLYQTFMRVHGLPTDGRVTLSDRQQEALEQEMARAGIRVPSGMHIDAGGNLNQKNRLVRNLAIGAAIGGGALLTAGALGAFGGAAGAGGAGAAGAEGGALVPLTGATGATGVGALGAGAGGTLGGSAIAGTTGGVSGLGSAVAGGAASAAGGFPWGKIAQYAIPAVGSVVQGYLGSNAAKDAAAIQSQAAQKGIDTINSMIPAEQAAQAQIYGGARGDLTNLYNQTAQTQANLYNSTGQTQNQVYNQTAAAYQPYQSLGAGSLSNLSRMIGGGPIAAAPSFQPVSFSPVTAPQFTASARGTGTGGSLPSIVQNPTPTPNTTAPPAQNLPEGTETATTPPTGTAPPQQQAAMQTATSYAPRALRSMASAPVRLRAPTGEEMDFAPNDPNLAKALQMGAQRVA